MNLVITMSRRFGTGASIIAKELSERLHIPVYDKDDVEHGMRENAFESEADAIRELAKQPCIIIGPVSYTHLDVYKRQLPQCKTG